MSSSIEPVATYGKASCAYCGDSPVDHRAEYINGSIGVFENKVADLPFFRSIFSFSFKVLNLNFEKYLFGFLTLTGLGKFDSSIDKAASIRSRVIWLEAERRGIKLEQYILFGKATDWYRARINGQVHYFKSLPIPPRYSSTHFWVDDKDTLKKRLRAKGIPVPLSFTATSEWAARRIFEYMRMRKLSMIIKPRTGSRGRHTSTFISDKEEFLKAFRVAKQINYFVQVEEHLYGNVCRATVVNGVLRGFLKAEPPRVTGDGVRTIQELIEAKNKNKPEKIADVIIKEELLDCIGRQGYRLDSILPNSLVLSLLFRTGRLFGGKTREMLPEIHPLLKEYLEKASTVTDTVVIGFDLIIEDPEKDPREQKWGIIEANSLPFIDLHDFAFEGAPANVAAHVWDLWDK